MFIAFLDVADGFEVFVQLLAIAVADLRPERARLREDGVEDAAVELTALAIAKQLVEEARRIDFFGGGFSRRHPRDVRTVNHRERSEEHTSELQSLRHLVCRLLLEK